MKTIYTSFFILLCSMSKAQTNISWPSFAQRDSLEIGGWHEVVCEVDDLDKTVTAFKTVFGWEELYRGKGEKDKIHYDEVVMNCTGENFGYVRLICQHFDRFSGYPQIDIEKTEFRTLYNIFDVDVRVLNIEKKTKELIALGWRTITPIKQYTFGQFTVKEVIIIDPNNITFALIERVTPALTGWPNLKEISQPFNSTQVVSDLKAALHLYVDVLGFKVYMHTQSKHDANNSLFGKLKVKPTKDSITEEVYILHPQGTNKGSVELIYFGGVNRKRVNPNYINGLQELIFSINNTAALIAKLKKQKIKFNVSTQQIKPYGEMQTVEIRTKDNARLRFLEQGLIDT
jgi:catechol 2,3-dioxygenase-like lactoylglutathione lyase family enzyme